MAKRNDFVIVVFEGENVVHDYPNHLPIPQVGNTVSFSEENGNHFIIGMVSQVKFAIIGKNMSEIRIICEKK